MATVALTYPLSLQLSRSAVELRDSRLNAYIQAWVFHSLTTNPTGLFNTNIFYPAKNTLALSENLLGNQWLFAPVYAITQNPMLSANVVMLASFVLCALFMYWLMRSLTGNWAAAAVAAFIYAFVPARVFQMEHMQLLSMQWIPLSILFLYRFLQRKRWRYLVGLVGSLLIQMLCSLYLGYITVIILSCFAVAFLAVRRDWADRRVVTGALFTALALGAVLYPLSRPYERLKKQGSLTTWLATASCSASPISSFLNAGWMHLYRDALDHFHSPDCEEEEHLYFGFLPWLLAACGVFFEARAFWIRRFHRQGQPGTLEEGKQEPRDAVLPLGMFWGAVLSFAVTYVLALDPYLRIGYRTTKIALPFSWLSGWVPGLELFRVPARIAMGSTVGLAILAGLGFAYLLKRMARARVFRGALGKVAVTGCVLLFLFAEFDLAPIKTRPVMVPSDLAPEYRWLAGQPRGSVTLELPVTRIGTWNSFPMPDTYEEAGYTYASSFDWQPLMNGYSGHFPQSAWKTFSFALEMPERKAVSAFSKLGLQYVILHTNRLSPREAAVWDGLSRKSGLRIIKRFPGVVIYEIVSGRGGAESSIASTE